MSPKLPRGDMYKIKICTKKPNWVKVINQKKRDMLKEKLRCALINKFDNFFWTLKNCSNHTNCIIRDKWKKFWS